MHDYQNTFYVSFSDIERRLVAVKATVIHRHRIGRIMSGSHTVDAKLASRITLLIRIEPHAAKSSVRTKAPVSHNHARYGLPSVGVHHAAPCAERGRRFAHNYVDSRRFTAWRKLNNLSSGFLG